MLQVMFVGAPVRFTLNHVNLATTPAMPVLRTVIDDYKAAITAAYNRDRVLVAQKNTVFSQYPHRLL